jgi:hypothetical protein
MAEWDGVVEIGFDRAEDVMAALGSEGYLRDVRPDEEQFLDMDKMIIVVTDESLLYEDVLGSEELVSAASVA